MNAKESSLLGTLFDRYMSASLILLISVGMAVGIILGLILPQYADTFKILGSLFVGALSGIAPLLVFILVFAAITSHKKGSETKLKSLVGLYLVGTFAAAVVAVIVSFMFPSTLLLQDAGEVMATENTVASVIGNLVVKIVSNPVRALYEANYISLIFWAVGLGLAFQKANQSTKDFVSDFAEAVGSVVRMIVRTAPFGVFSLVYTTVGTFGIEGLTSYIHVLAVLIGAMFFVGFVVNPLIVYLKLRQNPYPLIWLCVKNSGLTAFFTRSSAANIPVNMDLCRRLRLPEETYAISIPLGATINMAGAAITINVLTLAAANTLGIQVSFGSAILLCIVSAICACGASGVAGGSLMLIPLAASLFNISNEVAMQVVGVGFVIGVLQDSVETALNSSTDVVFTSTAVFQPDTDISAAVKAANVRE